MSERSLFVKMLAAVLIAVLSGVSLPVWATESGASLAGVVVRAGDRSPLAGAKVHVGDPKTGRIVTSSPSGEDGAFRVADLPAANYELAVEADGGLYVVSSAVALASGQARSVDLAVPGPSEPGDDDDDQGGTGIPDQPAKTSMWSNPLTAALIVLGSAVVIGVLVDAATDDDDEAPASP